MLENKKRHGCLTAYLIVMLIMNSATSLIYLLGGNAIKQNSPGMQDWTIPVLIALYNRSV